MVELPLLIRADKNCIECAALLDYELDLAYGKDENDFVIKTSSRELFEGDILYMDGTEYGGLISGIKIDTILDGAEYTGRTWQGVLEERILEPDKGQDFYTVEGELNTILALMLVDLGLDFLMVATTEDTGVELVWQFERYVDAYKGISAMLASVEHRLSFVWTEGFVAVSAQPIVDYTDDETLFRQKYTAGITIQQTWRKVNHLICAGKGDLAAREIVHLYADINGTISQTQTYTGLAEVVALYDYPNAESADVLIEKGIERLLGLRAKDTIEIDIDTIESYQVADLVGAVDGDLSVVRPITKKIVKVKDGILTVSYEVD